MKIPRPRVRLAFTLTELLVVIAIIGILAALLLTAISQVKGRALRIQCANNVRQLGIAVQEFRTDYNSYPPFLDPTVWSEQRYWKNALGYEMDIHSNVTFYPKGVWHCPSAYRPASNYPENWGYDNYGYNTYGLGLNLTNSLGLSEHWIPSQPTPHVNESEVLNPSEMIAIGDGFFGGPSVIQDGAGLGRASDNEILASLSWSTLPSDFFTESTKRARARHQGKANVVFCDGHVESPTLQFLFADTSVAALSVWNRDNQPHRERLVP